MSSLKVTGPTFSDLINLKQASLSSAESFAVGSGAGVKRSGWSSLGTDPRFLPCDETADIGPMLHQNDHADQRRNGGKFS